MASPRQVEPSASPPDSSSAPGSSLPESSGPEELQATLEALIANGERCRARLAALNPETGQYRVVLRERWPSKASAADPRSSVRKGPRSPEVRGRRFTIRDLLALERAEAVGDSLRSRIAAMLRSSRSVAARLEEVGPEPGEIRIILQGTLSGFAAGASTESRPDSDAQDATRKPKSPIKAATRSS